MKTFRTVGSGNTQTIEPIENNKIPVYETKTAAENDLANLEVGQIIATNNEGNELSNPVDVVQDGNMHAVTSNAVADYTKGVKVIKLSGNTDNSTGFFTISSLTVDNVIIGGTVLNKNDTYVLFSHYNNMLYAIPKDSNNNTLPNTYVELIIAYI